MLFHTLNFFIFIIIVLAFLFLFRKDERQKIILLIASCIFYMWWNPVFILLIFASVLVDYFVGQAIFDSDDKRRRKVLLILSMSFNLGLLAFFKYFNFFEDNLLLFLRYFGYEPSWIHINVILPVGISFYTFQTMSYTIDIYRKQLRPVDSFIDFAVFVSFFPQLVAGPIIRASDFLPQLKKKRRIEFKKEYLLLILKGLVKKVIIADNLGMFVDSIYAMPDSYPSSVIWIATIAFSVQIYSDFSGYTDIAIGVAAILGFNFPLNFDRPYFAKTPSEFWRKWHISLSSWLRDYLYISLGGNRKGNLFTYRNLMLTMLLGGLWHGASWNFVLWGLLHGIILIIYRYFNIDKILFKAKNIYLNLFSLVFMQIWVLLTWITFRQEDFGKMVTTINKFIFFDFNFSLQNIGLGKLAFFSTILILFTFWVIHYYSYIKGGIDVNWSKLSNFKLAFALFFIGIVLFFFWPTKEAPFIYFQF